MKCIQCGAEIEDGSIFCSKCGKPTGIQPAGGEPAGGQDVNMQQMNGQQAGADTSMQPDFDLDQTVSVRVAPPEGAQAGEIPADEKKIDILTGDNHADSRRFKRPGGSDAMRRKRRDEADDFEERENKLFGFKPGVLIGVIAAVVVVCVIIGLMSKGGNKASVSSRDEIAVTACVDNNDTAYIPLMNGKHVDIDDVTSAMISPDRNTIVVLDKSGELYTTDPAKKNKKVVEEELENGGFSYVDNDCVIYTKDNKSYIYRYGDEEPIALGDGVIDGSYKVNGGNLLFSMDQKVYLLTRDLTDKEKIGSYDYGCRTLYISKDGKRMYWAQEEDTNSYKIYTYKNGDREQICTYSSPYYPEIYFNADETYGLLGSSHGETFYILDSKGNATKVGMGNPLIFYAFRLFTANGYLIDDTSASFQGAYVVVDGGENAEFKMDYDELNLYYINKKGEREKKMMTGLSELSIQNGLLYYLEDDELHCAKLSGPEVKKDDRIAQDVDYLIDARGNNVFYITDSYTSGENEYWTIYVSERGGDPVKVRDEVYGVGYYISADGNTLYYFSEPDNSAQNSYASATLYKYDVSKKKSEKISDSVCIGMLSDGKNRIGSNSRILDDSFIFYKQVDSDDIHWIYYDGKKCNAMVEGLESDNLR
ncbi:MAG: zinc ribbon domain-containing protein [Lachnospiraceae bacterium]|nr:zinc ribbon domain-containing protein [Lachnospiraceae bacterium]